MAGPKPGGAPTTTTPLPVECCFDEVDTLLRHQARDDSNDGLVRVLLKAQTLHAAQQYTLL
jgi:hypothetical protein